MYLSSDQNVEKLYSNEATELQQKIHKKIAEKMDTSKADRISVSLFVIDTREATRLLGPHAVNRYVLHSSSSW